MDSLKTPFVTKASGERASFSESKLRRSLQKSGADQALVQNIVKQVTSKLYPGISTKEIYDMAFKMLRENVNYLAAKYHLKRAIMELGPSGYPFEKYIAEILKCQGFYVKVGEIVKGQCVNHEIDVIGEKESLHFMIECKYHNEPGIICNVKIPLYIHARFLDVEAQWMKLPGHSTKFHQGWIVTNTKFSSDALQYGTCVGLKLIGWNYPSKGSLKEQIDQLGLYPVTCLTTLTKKETQNLLDKKIVLCKEICENEKALREAGVNENRIKKVMEEGRRLCRFLDYHAQN